jgi:SAM-dependent methyltransferase
MTGDETITLYKWIPNEFTVEGRADSVSEVGLELASLIRPGDTVLDLCCGAGPFSFYLEKQGAQVTGIDFAPYMIELAREEATGRGSTVDFILGDVLTDDLGMEQFDLVIFMGNTLQDFSPSDFMQVMRNVAQALKPTGRFAIHYLDRIYDLYARESSPKEGIQQEEPERITYRFKEYLPEKGARVTVYSNESSGDEYEYTAYMYTVPLLRLLIGGLFDIERTASFSEKSFLDIFQKRQRPSSPQVKPSADA